MSESYQLKTLNKDDGEHEGYGEAAPKKPLAGTWPGGDDSDDHDIEASKISTSRSDVGGMGADGIDGNPVISTGMDVSMYLVSFVDRGDPAITLRGFVLGNFFLLLSSIVGYIYSLKPVSIQLSQVFIQLSIWVLGMGWAKILPTSDCIRRSSRFAFLIPIFDFINPGPFGIKEHVVATIIGTCGLNGMAGVDTLATMKLFYGAQISPLMAIMGLFSVGIMGVGLVGLLRPLIIYPSAAVYYYTLPMVAIFEMLHHEARGNRVRNFSLCFVATCLWEPVAAYIAPWLNGVSIPCIASMNAPMRIRKHIARIFGGASANQGMAYLSFSFDPQYVSPSNFAGFPLKWQANYWFGMWAGGLFILLVYYTDGWNAKTFPFLSSALFTEDGKPYPQDEVFGGGTWILNEDALRQYGTPRLTGSAVWAFFCQLAAIGALFTHVLLFMGKDMIGFVREHLTGTHHDPHYTAMKDKYKEVPQWWYLSLFALAITAAFITVTCTHTTLPAWGLVVALLVGITITPLSAMIYSQYGSSVATNMFSKMIAGAVHPGRPVANLWFANYCHQLVAITVDLADYQKLAIYLKVPHRVAMLCQCYATIVGSYLGLGILSVLVKNKHDILLDPIGDNQWSGSHLQTMNSQAVEWSLSRQVFRVGQGTNYELVPLGMLIGAVVPVIHWVLFKKVDFIRRAGEMITTPLVLMYLQDLTTGINSIVTSSIILGFTMQVYLRVYKPHIFREWCYLLSGAIDGAAQLMVVLLSFVVFGGNGHPRPFPTWFGNPDGPSDHCVTTRKSA